MSKVARRIIIILGFLLSLSILMGCGSAQFVTAKCVKVIGIDNQDLVVTRNGIQSTFVTGGTTLSTMGVTLGDTVSIQYIGGSNVIWSITPCIGR